jgi:hypothetical protein
MFIRKTIAVVAFVGALAATPATADVSDDVEASVRQFQVAVFRGDTDTLRTMLSDDFRTNYGGVPHDKDGFITAVASEIAGQSWAPGTSIDINNVVITRPAANVAVANYSARVTAPDGNFVEGQHMTVLQQDDQNNWVVHAHAGPNLNPAGRNVTVSSR